MTPAPSPQPRASRKRGYAIVEYLLAAAAVVGAVLAMQEAVRLKARDVTDNEITKVNEIPCFGTSVICP